MSRIEKTNNTIIGKLKKRIITLKINYIKLETPKKHNIILIINKWNNRMNIKNNKKTKITNKIIPKIKKVKIKKT